ncbi:MAG: hypothetical protein GY847_42210 [Proteobacteria bacterium]|nr:hypothetical protein [Pseudomonadota bacterium]
MSKSKRRSATDWKALVAVFKESGRTPRQFADQNDIPVSSFKYWLKKAAAPACNEQRTKGFRLIEVVGKVEERAPVVGGVTMALGGAVSLRFETMPQPEYLSSVAAAFAKEVGC